MSRLSEGEKQAALTRTQTYLRALYGEVDREDLDSFLSLDKQRLQVERDARVRNLVAQLRRACPRVAAVAGANFGQLVSSFASSVLFWEVKGRTLAENFCLHLHSHLSPEFEYLSDVAQLDGVVSGICTGKASPWPPSAIPEEIARLLEDGWLSEAMYTRRRLIDSAGLLPDVGNADECAEARASILVVQGLGTADIKLYRVDR